MLKEGLRFAPDIGRYFPDEERPFGVRVMPRPTPTQSAAAARREVSARARVPDTPVGAKTIAEVLEWYDAHVAQGCADADREYAASIQELIHRPIDWEALRLKAHGPKPTGT